jgi:hypothetical protein
VQPQAPGQQPGQRGQDGAVSPVRPGAGNLPPQHRDLMPQHEDLRALDRDAARQEHQPAGRADQGQVNETNKHESRA